MLTNQSWLPLFPLNTVLFPDGILPLKVFETRYIDMIKNCMKTETPFGVVLIKSGQEVGSTAVPVDVGCIANITQWDMPTLGLLMLRTQGGDRFRIVETRTLPDHRVEARVDMIASDDIAGISDIHVSCAKALKIVIDDISEKLRQDSPETQAFDSPFSNPVKLDSASWVANRWCEILPIPMKARQKLMELEDAQSRLAVVHKYLEQHEIL